MTIIAGGIDLAKHFFAVHGVDQSGRVALVRPSVACDKQLALIAALPASLIGMGALAQRVRLTDMVDEAAARRTPRCCSRV